MKCSTPAAGGLFEWALIVSRSTSFATGEVVCMGDMEERSTLSP